jgi:hypothetical protein
LQESAGFGSDPPPFWYPCAQPLPQHACRGDPRGQGALLASLADGRAIPLSLMLLARAEEKLGAAELPRTISPARAKAMRRSPSVPLARL